MPLSDTERGATTRGVHSEHAVWSVPGLYSEKTRSWGLISAEIMRRAEGEVNWSSDYYRVNLALTDLCGTVQVEGGRAMKLQQRAGMLSFTSLADRPRL
jgi:hypothetical protein